MKCLRTVLAFLFCAFLVVPAYSLDEDHGKSLGLIKSDYPTVYEKLLQEKPEAIKKTVWVKHMGDSVVLLNENGEVLSKIPVGDSSCCETGYKCAWDALKKIHCSCCTN